ncbi:MAG: HEAT repeat domain-containing protein [Elusimicrobia bacterium]|nr:HEAT repeat domain-containing protein [Elusimicrobiota bacterium]
MPSKTNFAILTVFFLLLLMPAGAQQAVADKPVTGFGADKAPAFSDAQTALISGRKDLKKGIPFLIGKLKDKDPLSRLSAADNLGLLKSQEALLPLTKILLKDSDSRVRQTAAVSLGCLQNPKAIDALIKALVDEAKQVQISSIRALAALSAKEAISPLKKLLQTSTDDDIRLSISGFLAKMGDNSTINECLAYLEHPNLRYRILAADALADMKSAPAEAALEKALVKEKNKGFKRSIKSHLRRIKAEEN